MPSPSHRRMDEKKLGHHFPQRHVWKKEMVTTQHSEPHEEQVFSPVSFCLDRKEEQDEGHEGDSESADERTSSFVVGSRPQQDGGRRPQVEDKDQSKQRDMDAANSRGLWLAEGPQEIRCNANALRNRDKTSAKTVERNHADEG